jgi:hypothetical protein
MKLAKLSAVVAALVAGAASLPAAAQTIPQPDSENGGLAFIAYNASTGRSLAQYLNLDLDSVAPGNIDASIAGGTGWSSGQFVLNSTAWNTAFGTGSLSDVRWMVVAGDSFGFAENPSNPNGFDLFGGLELSVTSLAGDLAQQNGGLESGLANLNNYFGAGWNGTCLGVAACAASNTPPSAAYAGTLGSQLSDTSGAPAVNFSTVGGISDTMNFFLVSGQGDVLSAFANDTRYTTGQFSLLNVTANGATLRWGSASVVPLPAAAWLLISGIAGLASVARRRTAPAAA